MEHFHRTLQLPRCSPLLTTSPWTHQCIHCMTPYSALMSIVPPKRLWTIPSNHFSTNSCRSLRTSTAKTPSSPLILHPSLAALPWKVTSLLATNYPTMLPASAPHPIKAPIMTPTTQSASTSESMTLFPFGSSNETLHSTNGSPKARSSFELTVLL